MFEILYVQLPQMLKNYKVMSVSLVIPEEYIFASSGVEAFPVNYCIPDSCHRRMFMIFKADGK
jgi:hypothetical protein